MIRTEYQVKYPDGSSFGTHVRIDPDEGDKKMYWDPTGLSMKEAPLYRANELNGHKEVFLVEGEKACDALIKMNYAAVAVVGGSSVVPDPSVWKPLAGRTVYLWPDNDEPGKKLLNNIAPEIAKTSELKIVTWKDAPEKGDAADLIETGEIELIPGLMKEAKPFDLASLPPQVNNLQTNYSIDNRFTVTKTKDIPKPQGKRWLMEPFVVRGNPAVLFGAPGKGKSWIALSIAHAIQNGRSFLGSRPSEAMNVAYLDWEDDGETFMARSEALLGVEMARSSDLLYIGNMKGRIWDLSRGLKTVFAAKNIQFVVIDSIAAACGGDLSIDTTASRYIEALKDLGVDTLSIGHTSKSLLDPKNATQKTVFGSMLFQARFRLAWHLASYQDPDGLVVTMENTKSNNGPKRPDIRLLLASQGGGMEITRLPSL